MRLFSMLSFSGFVFLLSCDNTVQDWGGGTITESGNYIYHDSLVLKVKVENDLVTFKMTDISDSIIFQNKYDFSDLHKWAMYLDKEKSLWVLSSDIGYSLWKRDPETHQYTYVSFDHPLRRNEVPKDLYSALEDFFD